MLGAAAPRLSLRLVAVIAILLSLAAVSLPAATPAQAGTIDLKAYLERLANRERTARGKAALKPVAGLRNISTNWSRAMANRQSLSHNPRRVEQVDEQVTTHWRKLGENVGYAGSHGATKAELARQVHRALMKSPGHRANILGDYNRIGVGVRIDGAGKLWVTQAFMKR